MNKLDLITNVEAHLLVDKAIVSTLDSLKESPLKSIREAAKFWEKQLADVVSGADNSRKNVD